MADKKTVVNADQNVEKLDLLYVGGGYKVPSSLWKTV
jgi:hypothetical protein